MKKIFLGALILVSASFAVSAAQPVSNTQEIALLKQIATQQQEQNQILKEILLEVKTNKNTELHSMTQQAQQSDLDKLNNKIQKNIQEQDENLKNYQAKHAEDDSKA